MKLRWLALVFAAFLLVSPTIWADDGSSGSLAAVVEQIVTWILGDSPNELGLNEPTGASNSVQELEGGLVYPPSG